MQGRVEVYYSGQWGTVCSDNWDLNDASVVCRSLGLPNATRAFNTPVFGEGSGSIWLNEVRCQGTETSLTDCLHGGWRDHNCGHSKDASVVCGYLSGN